MVYKYFNGYDPSKTPYAGYYTAKGKCILEVWTNDVTFRNQQERNEYFAAAHDDHVLAVELDRINDVDKFVFFIDDRPTNYAPVGKLPTNVELESMLLSYV